MMLLRRRTREVYRIYTEDEFLDGAGLEFLAGDESSEIPVGVPAGFDHRTELCGPAQGEGEGGPGDVADPAGYPGTRPGAGGRRLRRLTGAAMLAWAVGVVGALVVSIGPWSARSEGHRRAARGSLPAAQSHPRAHAYPDAQASSAAKRKTFAPALFAQVVRRVAPPPGSLGERGRVDEAGARRSGAHGVWWRGVERGGARLAVEHSAAAASPRPARPGPAEFGFER
jgi:hypothetical protein